MALAIVTRSWIIYRTCTRCITTAPNRIHARPPPARPHFEPPTNPPRTHRTLPPRRPTDRQIPFTHVYFLDPETNKRSATKHPLEDLLAEYTGTTTTTTTTMGSDARTHAHRRVLELVTTTPDPLVRITTVADIEARYKAAKRALQQKQRASNNNNNNNNKGDAYKEVQLTYGLAPADLAHKMRKAKKDLDKGYRVVVHVSTKHGHRRPSSQQAWVALADEIADALKDVGHEHKERKMTDRWMILSFRKQEAR